MVFSSPMLSPEICCVAALERQSRSGRPSAACGSRSRCEGPVGCGWEGSAAGGSCVAQTCRRDWGALAASGGCAVWHAAGSWHQMRLDTNVNNSVRNRDLCNQGAHNAHTCALQTCHSTVASHKALLHLAERQMPHPHVMQQLPQKSESISSSHHHSSWGLASRRGAGTDPQLRPPLVFHIFAVLWICSKVAAQRSAERAKFLILSGATRRSNISSSRTSLIWLNSSFSSRFLQ